MFESDRMTDKSSKIYPKGALDLSSSICDRLFIDLSVKGIYKVPFSTKKNNPFYILYLRAFT